MLAIQTIWKAENLRKRRPIMVLVVSYDHKSKSMLDFFPFKFLDAIFSLFPPFLVY